MKFRKDYCACVYVCKTMMSKLLTERVLADTLSRAYLSNEQADSNIENRDEFCTMLEEISLVADLPISNERIAEIRRSTAADSALQKIRECVENGWFTSRLHLPFGVVPYYSVQSEISYQDGLIFKARRIVVPQVLQEDIIKLLHSSHLGIEGCLRRAEILYWPKMSSQMRDLVSRCSMCNTYQPKQSKEPLISHETPTLPWSKVGVDLFVFENRTYLITVDYYSNFFEVDYLTSTTSTAVIKKLKQQFSCHGIPEMLFTDNGSQFVC